MAEKKRISEGAFSKHQLNSAMEGERGSENRDLKQQGLRWTICTLAFFTPQIVLGFFFTVEQLHVS